MAFNRRNALKGQLKNQVNQTKEDDEKKRQQLLFETIEKPGVTNPAFRDTKKMELVQYDSVQKQKAKDRWDTIEAMSYADRVKELGKMPDGSQADMSFLKKYRQDGHGWIGAAVNQLLYEKMASADATAANRKKNEATIKEIEEANKNISRILGAKNEGPASKQDTINRYEWQNNAIKTGRWDKLGNYSLMSQEGLTENRKKWQQDIENAKKEQESLRPQIESGEWEPDWSRLDSIYYNKKLQADIANERKILEGEGYTPEQKYTAQSTLNKLLKQEEDEKTERSRSTDNSMGAMFNAGVMEDLQKQENRPEYVYDRINGEGSYKERTSGMTAEEKQALDSQIEDALKGATSPQITYSNLDEQIYRANLNIKEIDRRMKGIDSLDQLTGSNMQVTQAEEKVSQLEEELAYYESDENKDWGWAKALAEETRTALDEAKQELYDIQTAEKSGLLSSQMNSGAANWDLVPRASESVDEWDVLNMVPGGDSAQRAYFYVNMGEYQPDTKEYRENRDPGQMHEEEFMLPEWKKRFNQYYGKGSDEEKAAAMAYLDGLRPYLREMKASYEEDYVREIASSPAGAGTAFARIALQPAAGLQGLAATMASILGNEDAADPNGDWHTLSRVNQTIQDERGDVWDEALVSVLGEDFRGVGKFLNGAVYSIADNLVAMGITKGLSAAAGWEMGSKTAEKILQSIMSSEATASEFMQQLNDGTDPTEAAFLALANGAIEWYTENMGWDALFSADPKALLGHKGDIMKYLLKNAGSEGMEEISSDVFGLATDLVVSAVVGHENEIQREADQMMLENEGMSYGDAVKAVLLKHAKDTMLSGAAGALSGFAMSGGNVAMTAMRQNVEGRTINRNAKTTGFTGADNMIKAASLMGETTNSRRMANEIQNMIEGGKKVSNYQLGKLAESIVQETNEEAANITKGTVEQIVKDQLAENGLEGPDAAEAAEVITKAVTETGGVAGLTTEERSILAKNRAAIEVAKSFERNPGTIMKANMAIAKNTQNQQQVMQIVREAVTEKARESRGMASAQLAESIKTAQQATAEEIRESGADAGSALGAVYDGQAVEVSRIENGQVVLSNGEHVDADTVKAVSGTVAAVINYAKRQQSLVSNDVASIALLGAAKNNNISTVDYMRDVERLNLAGQTMGAMPHTAMDKKTATAIFEQARRDFESADKKRVVKQQKITEGKGTAKFGDAEYGSDAWEDAVKDLDPQVRERAEVLAEINKRLGNSVSFVYDEEKSTTYGWEDGKTGEITINLAAKNYSGKNQHLLTIFGHEMTHWLEQNSWDGYNRLRTFILSTMRQNGYSVESLIMQTIGERNEANEDKATGMSVPEAMAELVANASDQVFGNQKIIDRLQQTDESLFDKLKQHAKDFISRAKAAISDMAGFTSRESRTMLQRDLDKIADLWMEARDEALNRTEEGAEAEGTQYAIRQSNGEELVLSDEEIEQNKANISNMKPVVIIKTNNFQKTEEADFKSRAIAYLDKQGGVAKSPIFGPVEVGRAGVEHLISLLTSRRAGTVEAIIPVIENGEVISVEEKGVSHDFDSAIVAAPITYLGKDYYMGVVIKQNESEENSYYMHDAILADTKGGLLSVNKSLLEQTLESNPTIARILATIPEYNGKNGKTQESVAQKTDAEEERLLEEYRKAKSAVQDLRQQFRDMKPEYDAKVKEIMANKNQDEAIEEYQKWEQISGYGELKKALDEAEEVFKKANKAFDDYVEQRDIAEEKQKIQDSGLPEADWRRKEAVKEFGTTTDFREAGYLMPNGKLLNFSGEKGRHYGTRGEDHRGIGRVYASNEIQGSKAMLTFMADGNIRVMAETPGIDINSSTEPTAEQYAAIRNMANRFAGEEYFNVDFTDERGNTVDSIEYDGRVNGTKIVNDIKSFYKTGTAPQQSLVSQFHYSMAQVSQEDQEYADAVERGDLETATAMLMDKLQNSENIIPFNAPEWYGGQHKDIAQMIKNGTPEAVARAAAEMASYVPDNAVLVPMPPHEGKVLDDTDTKILADAIGELTGRPVVVALESDPRESRYQAKSEGRKGVRAEDMGFRQIEDIPEGMIPIFVDNVVGSGETAKAAMQAMGGGITLSYAKSSRSQGIQGLKRATVTYDKDGNLIPLSQRFNAGIRDIRYAIAQDGEEMIFDSLDIPRDVFFKGTDAEISEAEQKEEARANEFRKLIDNNHFMALEFTKPDGRVEILHRSSRPGIRYQLSYIGSDGIPNMHESYGTFGDGKNTTENIHSMDELYKHLVSENSRRELKMTVLNDPVVYDNTGNVIPLSERFDQEKADIRYAQAQADMNVNQWMLGLNPDTLATEQEKNLLKQYKEKRMAADLARMAVTEQKAKIRKIETKQNITAFDRSELVKANNILQNYEQKLAKAEEDLAKITSSEGYAGMMYRQSRLMNELITGRSAEEIMGTVEALQRKMKDVDRQIQENAENLEKLAQAEGVVAAKAYFAGNGLREAARKLKQNYMSSLNIQEIENRLAGIALKLNRNGYNAEEVMDDVSTLAQMLEDKTQGAGEQSYVLQELRGSTFYLNKAQMKELTGTNRNLRDVNRQLAGTGIRIREGKGRDTTLDMVYDQLRETIPSLSDVTDTEMLDELLNVVDRERRSEQENLIRSNMGEVIQGVFEEAMALAPMKDAGKGNREQVDGLIRYISELAGEARKSAEVMNDLQAAVKRMSKEAGSTREAARKMDNNITDAIKYFNSLTEQSEAVIWRGERAKLISQMKDEKTQELLKEQQKWKDRIEKDKQVRSIMALNAQRRSAITVNVNRLRRLLEQETDQKNVPEHMKPLAWETLRLIVENDIRSNRRQILDDDKVIRTRKASQAEFQGLQRTKQLIDQFFRDNGKFTTAQIQDITEDTDVQMIIAEALDKIDSGLGFYNASMGKDIKANVQGLSNALDKILDGLTDIMQIIKAGSSVFINGRRMATQNAADAVKVQLQNSKFKGEYSGKTRKIRDGFNRMIIHGNMTAPYFFKNLRNAGMDALWKEMTGAENRSGLEYQKAKEYLAELAERTGYGTWDTKKKYDMKLGGTDVKMTLENMMALYATWQREMTENPEMSQHMELGGVYIDQEDMDQGIAGRAKPAMKANRVTEADMNHVIAMLSPEQIEWVNGIVKYLSSDLAEIGNETSMKMFGIKKYKEKYYFPIKIWDGVKSARSDSGISGTNENRAAHQGFTKRRVNNARNAIVIGNFTDIAVDHIVGMINYATVAPAVENLNRVLNIQYSEGYEETETKRNLRMMFQEAYGREALNYLETFMKDVNGGVSQDRRKTIKEAALRIFKKNAVAGSLSVAFQQPLSYIRANMMINPKYMTKALLSEYWKGSYKERMKYSGVSVLKDMGPYDINLGLSAKEYMKPDGKETVPQKIWGTISEYATILPGLMDRWTWNRLWVAVKAEQKALHPEMDVKSDEFMNTVADRFNEVMRSTQVYDSIMVKSSNMRSQNPLMKDLTSFMAEPTLTLNVLRDAVINVDQPGGKLRAAKAGALFALSAVMQAAVKAIISSGRTPDEKKTLAENFMNKFWYNALSELDPLQSIPGYGDLITVLKGGDVTDDALGVLTKIPKAGMTMVNGITGNGNGWYRDLEDGAAQLMQIFTGVPGKNIMRDMRAMFNLFTQGKYDKRADSAAVMKYQFIDTTMNADNLIGVVNKWLTDAGEGYLTTNKGYYERIYNAEKAGNKQAAFDMKDYLTLGRGVSEKTIQTNLRKAAKEDDSLTAEQSLNAQKEYGLKDTTDYILEQYREGNINRKEAERLYRQEKTNVKDENLLEALDKVDRQNAGMSVEGYSNYTPLLEAMEANKVDDINAAVKRLMDNGYTASRIQKYVNDKYKETYLDTKAGSKERVKLQDAISKAYKATGATAEDAKAKMTSWEKEEAKEVAAAEKEELTKQIVSGKLSVQQAMKKLQAANPKLSDNDAWFEVDRIKYTGETGKEPEGSKYYRIYDAIDTGKTGSLSRLFSDIFNHGASKSAATIVNTIWDHYDEKYMAMNQNDRAKLKNMMIIAIKAAGVNNAEQRLNKKINASTSGK